MSDPIRVVELFAGIGGFRYGLEQSSPRYKTIWANQWEPGKVKQFAFDCYVAHFGDSPNHVNEDIAKVTYKVPEHDLLVGGFPCQDYSVARTGAKGIEGKKGVLWWEINAIIDFQKPKYVLLENVDRLVKSPGSQRGRDLGIILRCLYDLGYSVEWRIINAADYGNAQRRRRTFIFAFRKDLSIHKELETIYEKKAERGLFEWVTSKGFFAPSFPVVIQHHNYKKSIKTITPSIYPDLASISSKFKAAFYNSGVMINGNIYSEELCPFESNAKTLKSVRLTTPVDQHYFLDGDLKKWQYLKGPKRINRIRPNGEPYVFSEGGMCFPDNLDLPSRTMLTSESSVNRSTHVIKDHVTGKLRLLTPIECEKLDGFPDDWTNTGMPEKFRYFVLGNALVVPLITCMGNRLLNIIDNEMLIEGKKAIYPIDGDKQSEVLLQYQADKV